MLPFTIGRLSLNKKVAAIRHYYQSAGNQSEASRRLAKEFKCKKIPDKTIRNIIDKF